MQKIELKFDQPEEINDFVRIMNPVSYTHLDVYKRQPISRTGT